MGEAKRKNAMMQNGSQPVSKVAPDGFSHAKPPTNNMGGKEGMLQAGEMHQTGPDRYRVNVSLPPAVHRALTRAALVMGTSASQVTLQAIINGLPALTSQVGAALSLGGNESD